MKITHFILLFVGLLSLLSNCDPVQCMQIKGSQIGYVVSCTSLHPFPLKVTSTVKLTMSQYFKSTSWNFWLRSYKGQLTKVTGCILTNPTYDVYNIGQNLTIGIICYELPRQLNSGDYIHVNFFDDQGDQFRLTYIIPILGYSSIQSIQQDIKKMEMNQQTVNTNIQSPSQKVISQHILKEQQIQAKKSSFVEQ